MASDVGRPDIRVVSAEIQRGGRWLLVQRSERAVLPLLWEFPGGRVREGESDREALVRTLIHRIGVVPDVRERILEVRHDYDDWGVVLAVYRCELGDAEPVPADVHDLAWVLPEDFAGYPFPPADLKSVALLLGEER
ncbi:MAG: (deoxy)nucleoside triphosphate pyrophosphohydrolase [Alphaproteobacteria bacterium]|nr:(deoxy)nucleoside triphosphate pyrophosphohydrolase [Alphaproteobacteria bacterium]